MVALVHITLRPEAHLRGRTRAAAPFVRPDSEAPAGTTRSRSSRSHPRCGFDRLPQESPRTTRRLV